MIKKASIIAPVVCLLLILLNPSSVQAQSGLLFSNNSARVEFPTKLSFNLSVESDVNITDIRLYYAVDKMDFAQVTSEVYIEFEPATSVDAEWTWDMRRTGGLPPGSSVDYWWTVEDANGSRVKTAPTQVQFDDNRYPWQSITEDKVTIYWYEGGKSYAQELMTATQQALARLTADTGAELEKPAKIYIYESTGDLRGAMIYPQEWTGGVAFTRYGTIAIGIAPDNLNWGKRTIAHELTHLVIHQMTLNPYNDLPTWLDEGLAMYAEGELEPEFMSYLNKAIADENLISVRSLSSPFSAYTDESLLSYAQSYSLVEFLINNYGQDKMLELLKTFNQGSSYDGALEKAYGFNMDGLDSLWRDHVTMLALPIEDKGVHPAIIGTLAGLATVLLLVFGLAAERWAWRRGH
jgi:hypothetical protein